MEYKFEAGEDDAGLPMGVTYTMRHNTPDSKSEHKIHMMGRGLETDRIVVSRLVKDDAGSDQLFLECTNVMDQRTGEEVETCYFLMNGPTGSFKRFNSGGKWTSAEFLSALKMKSGSTWSKISKHWKDMELSYVETRKQTGHAVLESMASMWEGKETCAGDSKKQGFLHLYALFTGKTKAKVVNQDNGRTLATLYTRMLLDCDEFALLPSILNQLSRNPALCEKLSTAAVYSDRRKKKGPKVSSEPVGSEASPLAQLFVDMIPQIVESQATSKPEAADRCTIEPPPTSCATPTAAPRAWVVQKLQNYSNPRRVLSPVTEGDLAVDAGACAVFGGRQIGRASCRERVY
jgi:hypothetical protein